MNPKKIKPFQKRHASIEHSHGGARFVSPLVSPSRISNLEEQFRKQVLHTFENIYRFDVMNHTTMSFRRHVDDPRNQTFTHHLKAPSSTALPASALPSFNSSSTKMKLKTNGKVIEVMGSATGNNSNTSGVAST